MGIEWNETLTSGIEAIDLQHQQIINALNQILSLQKQPDRLDELVSRLLDFSKLIHSHFDYEENLLREYGYKELRLHKAGHEEISDLINSLTMSVMLDGEDIKSESINRIISWFKDHLTSEDKRYFKMLNKQI